MRAQAARSGPTVATVGGLCALVVLVLLAPGGGGTSRAQPGVMSSGDGLRRFALVAGNNEGGEDTRTLRFAGDDARRLYAVLTELGGVKREDAVLLVDGDASGLWNALGALEQRLDQARARGERTALFVYYSGHAKDGALRMGNSRLPMDALRQRLASQSRADVRIAIFDACRSGVVNRTKGARKGPAFEVAADGPTDAQGMVFWSSSSADEDAQESDTLGGSYFSHHLVSGLRGSADRSGDRRVTLSEAYEYAYARTVAATAETAAGAQHPTFSYDLKGNGNLVLAELGLGREGLYLPAAAPAGIYYLVDAGRGVVSAEVVKVAAADRVIALPPGRYKVKRRLADRLRIGDVRIDAGRYFTLDEAQLADASFADDPVKGQSIDLVEKTRVSLSLGGGMQAFFDAPTRAGLFPPTGLFAAELSLRHFFRRDWVWAFDLALGQSQGTLVREAVGVELPFRFAEVGVGSSLIAEWRSVGWTERLTPFVGGRMAFLLMTREFEKAVSAIPEQHLSTFSPGVVGGVHVRFADDLQLTVRGRVHYLHYDIDENRSLGYWELGAMLAYQLGASK